MCVSMLNFWELRILSSQKFQEQRKVEEGVAMIGMYCMGEETILT